MIKEELTGGKWFQFGAAFVACFLAITDGMAVGWTSPMIPYFLSDKTHIVMTRYAAEWMETCLLLGALIGLPLTAFTVERIGRKKALLLSCCILIVTWIVIMLANHIGYIYVARFTQGFGLNMAFIAMPMYIGEIAHKSIRGFLSSLIFAMSIFGTVVIYVVGPILPFYVSNVIAIFLLAVELIVFSFMPESPHFLIVKGRLEEATRSLQQFRKCIDVDEELKEIRQTIENDNKEKGQFREIFLVKNYRKALMIMLVLNWGQLFSCFEVIVMNLHEILESAGSVHMTGATAAIIFSVINLCSSITAALLVDKFGRKILLIISTFLTGLCIFSIALYFHLKQLNFDTISFSWVPIVSVMTYAAVFKVGLGMVPIIFSSELFASKIKAFGVAFADGVYVLSSVLALQVFFFLRDMFGMYMPFYFFCCCSMITLIFILLVVPETKGKKLEEIQEILRK